MIISNQLPDRQMDFQPHLSEKQMKDNFMVALGKLEKSSNSISPNDDIKMKRKTFNKWAWY